MEHLPYAYIAVASIVVGYLFFVIVAKILPNRLQTDQQRQRDDILGVARNQAVQRKADEVSRIETTIAMLREDLEADIEDRKANIETKEEDIEARHRSFQMEEARVKKMEGSLEARQAKVDVRKQEWEEKRAELDQSRVELVEALTGKAETSSESVLKNSRDKLVESRQIEAQKSLKLLDEELEVSTRRLAARMMSRTMARYAPEFYWPKAQNFVEVMEARQVEALAGEQAFLLEEMHELAGVEVELLADKEGTTPIVKLAGGAGINREAARMALGEILNKKGASAAAVAKAGETYARHRELLEQEAVRLGKKAVRQLRLKGIHPEVQKLVGYLNWRTSYRQNQWYHTVEVATLAGILANELGVDPDQAKRCGLLHDIGKAIDYRIEGSHAVISGDYADRFGESRLICDTVMSHHNDLVLETSLSYVLKCADTLSGARPGARVNLEEGYQTRISGIDMAVRSFQGVMSVNIMNGAREVHVEVNNKRVRESDMQEMSRAMAKKISEDVAFPGEIKVVISRVFEATAVA